MPSRLKNEVFSEIEEYELEDMPVGTTIEKYIETVVEDIDPEISGFVKELMLLGYPTYTSCAGGPGHCTITGGMGFVTLEQSLVPEEIKEIKALAKKYHLTGVKFKNMGSDSSRILFNPIGSKPTGH